jgi:Trk K+ transport system NAD-binding subunit
VLVEDLGGVIPFARARDLEKWSVWIRREQIKVVNLICDSEDEVIAEEAFDKDTEGLAIPMTFSRNSEFQPLGHLTRLKKKDQITCLVHIRKMEQFEQWLEKSIFIHNYY